jgi:hypothetical protein
MIARRAVIMRVSKWFYIGCSIVLLIITLLWMKYMSSKGKHYSDGEPIVVVQKAIDYKAMYERDSVLLHALMDSIVVLRTMINAKENVVVEIPRQKGIPKLSVSSSNEFNEYLMTRYKDSIK